jgi:hypothetical protein
MPATLRDQIQRADLLIVTGTSWSQKLIEIGAVLRGEDSASHIAVYWGVGKTGIPLCIEGRPGGVGWKDARAYLNDSRTIANVGQPKTPAQRDMVCDTMVKLLGTQYGWLPGIAADAAEALGLGQEAIDLDKLWAPDPKTGKLPGEVVCSSGAAWAYGAAKLATPRPQPDWERVTPGDWKTLTLTRHWQNA